MSPKFRESRDGNEREIVKALEVKGATVQRLSGGNGRPDLLVGYNGGMLLMEVKNPSSNGGARQQRVTSAQIGPGGEYEALGARYGMRAKQLKVTQAKWFSSWQGPPPLIVESVDEAVAALVTYDLPFG